ncbi:MULTISPECIES: malonate decarboxylase subunit alpha [unclassified Chelatococcus]|uniref:CoA transferase subunit A n=1 Tax=unclassified Chelatococcus TaxID=2638111 RepID=UPI001BCD6F49|nr:MULTISPECIES: malonate decarboxylase subunit alpha [unclassified Chelatococcus]MBS7697466.1 CoA transferase subunit A [Chelatococcus sp. YT9]MBX3560030.1 CoA transferase subunit A [Chelatococcus sp.]
MTDKVLSIGDAIRGFVPAGSLVFVGGFGQGVPFAAGREIIRQGITGLTLCRTGADILFDLLVAAGAADRIVVGWFGNPGVGISHICRKAIREGRLALTETSNFGLLLQLEAAALGVPFLPAHVLSEGDLGERADRKPVVCPFTGGTLSAVPALTPDVALVHALRADRHGNVQADGIMGDTLAGARAAKSVVVTVEEIVDDAVIRSEPERTILPAHRVSAVVHAPFGAWPSYVKGLYDRDDEHYVAFDRLSRDPSKVHAYLAAIRAGGGLPDPERRAELMDRAGVPAHVL